MTDHTYMYTMKALAFDPKSWNMSIIKMITVKDNRFQFNQSDTFSCVSVSLLSFSA